MNRIYTYILFFVVLLSSCEKDDICPENSPQTPRALINFAIEQDGVYQPIELLDFNVWGIKDGVLQEKINTSTTAKDILLPIDFSTQKTEFLFEVSGNNFIVSTSYIPELQLVSKACGYRYIFNDFKMESQSVLIEKIISLDGKTALGSEKQVAATIFFKIDQNTK